MLTNEQIIEGNTARKKRIVAGPDPHQFEAIGRALVHYKNNDRGQLILPCGAGKTLTSLWITEALSPNLILVMIPSLALVAQTLKEWSCNTVYDPFNYLALCGDTTVDDDISISELYEQDIRVTTDAFIVAEFLQKPAAAPKVLLCTYQSSKVLVDAMRLSGLKFDIAIYDEGHRIAGQDTGVWGLSLSDDNVPVSKRLFMTATPRIHAPHVKEKAIEKDVTIYSMDDPKVFGTPFYEMTFAQAIELGLLSDYEIIVRETTDDECKRILKKHGKVTKDGKEYNANMLAKQLALLKAINEYGITKVFSFHSSVAKAQRFTSSEHKQGIKQIAKVFMPEYDSLNNLRVYHVNGKMSSKDRLKAMEQFETAELSIMSNARCLTEGITALP
jgi:predicted helicase